jgi:hypothetical protein
MKYPDGRIVKGIFKYNEEECDKEYMIYYNNLIQEKYEKIIINVSKINSLGNFLKERINKEDIEIANILISFKK